MSCLPHPELVRAGSSSHRLRLCMETTEQNGKWKRLCPVPFSPYGFSKWIDEVYASQFARTTGLETVSLRYFNVFGSRQRPDTQYAVVIPIFIDKLIRDANPTIFGDGTQTGDFTFVNNIVRGKSPRSEGVHPEKL
jgi:nucleoside-diphosphate-sugar epimerase